MKHGAECASSDEKLGDFSNVQICADACARKPQCQFFIYGVSSEFGTECWWERTSSASCPEGWESDSYDFYQIISPFGNY